MTDRTRPHPHPWPLPRTRAARALAFIALAALPVAACGPRAPAGPASKAQAPAPAMLAGIDLNRPLRVLGTEPFWGVDVTADALVYSGVERPEQRAPNPGPTVQGTTATWTTITDAGPMTLTVMATQCSDGMSDRAYPLTARLEVGDERLTGCALPAADLAAAPPA